MRIAYILLISLWTLQLSAQDGLESIIKSEGDAVKAVWDFKEKKGGDPYDLVYQHLKLNIDPAVRMITGSVFSRFESAQSGMTDLRFDLDVAMTVDSVLYHGQPIAFTHAQDVLQLAINSLNLGQLDSVEVFYHGDPSTNPFKGFSYDNHLTGPIAWTLSEPYGAYGWWPCKQQLADKIDSFDMSIQVPAGNKAAGLGLLHRVDTLASQDLVFHWKHRYPVASYLVAVAVTNYAEFTHQTHFADGDSMPVLEYMYPEFMGIADTQAARVEPMLYLMDSLCGPYPFRNEKYGHAQWGRGGGMEHQTMSFMSDLDFGLVAHELAHQWYGDKITCGSWQDIWLNEGFATYLTAIAYEFLGNQQEWENYMHNQLNRATSGNDGSVFVYDTSSVSRIFSGRLTYSKGCMVLQMLRWEIGDDAFFQGLRNYTASAGICYDFARTADLLEIMEAASGKELDDFFDRWIYQQGFPLLSISWRRKTSTTVSFDVAQVPTHHSVSFYPLNIEFRLLGEQGEDTLMYIEHRNLSEVIDLDVGFKVTAVEYDPRIWLMAKASLTEGEHQDLTSISVFPNPSRGAVALYLRNKRIDKVDIYDRLGRLVHSEEPASRKNIPVTIQHDLARGLYFVSVSVGGESVVVKMLVQ